MPVIHQLTSQLSANPLLLLAVLPAVLVLAPLLVYLKDHRNLRQFPGPILAKFTDTWIFWTVSHNRWAATVSNLHKEYGTSSPLVPQAQHLTFTPQVPLFELLRITSLSPTLGPFERSMGIRQVS